MHEYELSKEENGIVFLHIQHSAIMCVRAYACVCLNCNIKYIFTTEVRLFPQRRYLGQNKKEERTNRFKLTNPFKEFL